MAIDERSGVVRTTARLDRDTLCTSASGGADACQVRLDIVVQPMSHFRIVTVAVDLVDINDNSPRFDVDFLSRDHVDFLSHDLGESASPGEEVLLPAPSDADTGVNGVQRYRLDYVDGGTAATDDGKDDFELRATRKLDGSTELKLVLVKLLNGTKAGSREAVRPRGARRVPASRGRSGRRRSSAVWINRRRHPRPRR